MKTTKKKKKKKERNTTEAASEAEISVNLWWFWDNCQTSYVESYIWAWVNKGDKTRCSRLWSWRTALVLSVCKYETLTSLTLSPVPTFWIPELVPIRKLLKFDFQIPYFHSHPNLISIHVNFLIVPVLILWMYLVSI